MYHIRGKVVKNVRNNILHKVRPSYGLSVLYALFGVFILNLVGCSDEIDTSKSSSGSNNDFKLTLTISDDIVRFDDSIKLTARVERKAHKDSITNKYRSMIMDAVGGTIDGHSFSSQSAITVTLNDEKGAKFEARAFFVPQSTYNSATKSNEYKDNGYVSVSFDGINLSMTIKLVEPR